MQGNWGVHDNVGDRRMSAGQFPGGRGPARGRGRFLSEVAVGRENHFNLLRMLAASGVILSHAHIVVTHVDTPQPLTQLLGRDLGTLCVYVFFAISGFFVAQSFERAPSMAAYLRARALRLFPALLVMLVLTALLGFVMTAWPAGEYWSAAVGYVLRNLVLAQVQFDLADLFATHPMPGWVNVSIWTLFYEVLGYLGILFAGLFGAFRRPAFMAAVLGVFLVIYAVAMTPAFGIHETMGYRKEALFQFSLPFAIGTAAYVWRHRVRLDPVLLALLVGVVVLVRQVPLLSPLSEPVLTLTLSYGALVLGYLPWRVPLVYNRLGDYSYSIYIYAFPMQQIAVLLGAGTALANAAFGFLLALPLAVLSWHLIEKPALALKRPATTPAAGSERHAA